jgi:hypothetical protein
VRGSAPAARLDARPGAESGLVRPPNLSIVRVQAYRIDPWSPGRPSLCVQRYTSDELALGWKTAASFLHMRGHISDVEIGPVSKVRFPEHRNDERRAYMGLAPCDVYLLTHTATPPQPRMQVL